LPRSARVIIFNNAGCREFDRRSADEPLQAWRRTRKAFIDGLGLTKVDLLGFSIGEWSAADHTRPLLSSFRKLILGRNRPAQSQRRKRTGDITPETAAIFGATYDPPENLWLKVFFTDSEKSQAEQVREFLNSGTCHAPKIATFRSTIRSLRRRFASRWRMGFSTWMMRFQPI